MKRKIKEKRIKWRNLENEKLNQSSVIMSEDCTSEHKEFYMFFWFWFN